VGARSHGNFCESNTEEKIFSSARVHARVST